MEFDVVIVGAGPAGLQMGYFLTRANRDYLILEKGNGSGEIYRIRSIDCGFILSSFLFL